jgi:hypothetical protein
MEGEDALCQNDDLANSFEDDKSVDGSLGRRRIIFYLWLQQTTAGTE